jgi:hypothetical protein
MIHRLTIVGEVGGGVKEITCCQTLLVDQEEALGLGEICSIVDSASDLASKCISGNLARHLFKLWYAG